MAIDNDKCSWIFKFFIFPLPAVKPAGVFAVRRLGTLNLHAFHTNPFFWQAISCLIMCGFMVQYSVFGNGNIETSWKMEPAWARVNGGKFSLVEYRDQKGELRPCYSLTKTECLYIATYTKKSLCEKWRVKNLWVRRDLKYSRIAHKSFQHQDISCLIAADLRFRSHGLRSMFLDLVQTPPNLPWLRGGIPRTKFPSRGITASFDKRPCYSVPKVFVSSCLVKVWR